jgi:anaerobic magnesium-protoporphyrin IX monomethyl ester cyclase
MKTLLIALHPYNSHGLDAWHDHGAGMTYAAAKAQGCDIDFLDMNTLHNENELRSAMSGYELISFGLKSSYYPLGMKVKQIAKAQGSKVIVGGYHVTAAPEELLNDEGIDWVFDGESEITFPKFLRDSSNYPRFITGERPDNLDDLPWVDHSIFREPLEDCSGWWYGGRRKMISVIAARGCPYQCAFCQPLEDNHFGKKLRRRSVDSVIAEILDLKTKFNPDCLMIHDDTFFLQTQWLEEFVEKYPQVGLPFWAASRADGLCKHSDLFRKLVSVGWELVSVGFESGSQRMLDIMKKGTTVSENIEAGKIIKSSGAKIYANYMLGLPWEHKEDVQLTMQMADEIKAEMPSWAYFTPYPGCELGETCIHNGWSLLTKDTYDRCPSGEKVKFVDYDYLRRCLGGFREEHPPLAVDIIIPCYENEELTLQCLASIKQFTNEHIYRVILIDNGSKDTTKVELMLATMPHIFLKLSSNEGFVGAINHGLAISTAPTICLLNNDTRVTEGWVEKCIKALYSDESFGIVGPLTGFSKFGCDSQHSLTLHKDLLPPLARSWDIDTTNKECELRYKGRTEDLAFIAFMCAFIKREVLNKVTNSNPRYKEGIDPNFKMGMWDDVDYCTTAKKLGYKTRLVIDTCIYHKGRSTFNLLETSEKLDVEKLLRDNKRYLDIQQGTIKLPLLQKKNSMRMIS